MGQGILSSALGSALYAIFLIFIGFILAFLLSMLRLRKKQKLYRFFGIERDTHTLYIYLSTLIIPQKFRAATFRYDPTANSLILGGYQGLAISAGELAVINIIVNDLLFDPIDDLPKFVKDWLRRINSWFQPLRVTITPSPHQPLKEAGFKFTSLVSVGTQTYNSVTDYYANYQQGYLRFNTQDGQIEILKGSRKGEKISSNPQFSGGLAFLERTVDDEHKSTVFIAAGNGVPGSVGATKFLVQEWESIFQRYKEKPFAVVLHFESSNDLDNFKQVKKEWFPDI